MFAPDRDEFRRGACGCGGGARTAVKQRDLAERVAGFMMLRKISLPSAARALIRILPSRQRTGHPRISLSEDDFPVLKLRWTASAKTRSKASGEGRETMGSAAARFVQRGSSFRLPVVGTQKKSDDTPHAPLLIFVAVLHLAGSAVAAEEGIPLRRCQSVIAFADVHGAYAELLVCSVKPGLSTKRSLESRRHPPGEHRGPVDRGRSPERHGLADAAGGEARQAGEPSMSCSAIMRS